MSKETLRAPLHEILSIPGVYVHGLHKFTNGKVSIDRKGIIKLPICLPAEELGGFSNDDIRVALPPHVWDNKLVPMLCLIEPEAYYTARREGQDEGISAAIPASNKEQADG